MIAHDWLVSAICNTHRFPGRSEVVIDATVARHWCYAVQTAPKPTVVVAEDSEPLRYAIRRFLQQHGFDVLEAADGANALVLVAAHPVDFVVTDYRMPRMDGLALAERLNAKRPEIPVLFISATDNDQLVESHPQVELMRKPVDLEALLARIRKSVEPR